VTNEEFEAAGRRLYGEDWRAPLGEALELSNSTIWRYWVGKYVIPKKVELAVERLLQKQYKRKARP
jgi:hypothetical protein